MGRFGRAGAKQARQASRAATLDSLEASSAPTSPGRPRKVGVRFLHRDGWNQPTPSVCPLCFQVFENRYSMRCHYLLCVGGFERGGFYCTPCRRNYRLTTRSRHEQTWDHAKAQKAMLNNVPFYCEVCGKSLRKTNRARHSLTREHIRRTER